MIVSGNIGNIEYSFIDVDNAETIARLGLTAEQINDLKRQTHDAVARLRCRDHIERHYPPYKQINILRSGTDAEKASMGDFIDRCRAWSNGESQDPAALEAIQP